MEETPSKRADNTQPTAPLSPRTVARRVLNILKADTEVNPLTQGPSTVVKESLGAHSSSHPNVSFAQGGGFTAETEVRKSLTQTEQEEALKDNIKKWESHGSKGRKPTEVSPTVLLQKGSIEYHPPGGIHSDYNQRATDDQGSGFGSYLRVKTSKPNVTETRIGRHGAFKEDETFEKKRLNSGARHKKDKLADLTPQAPLSPPPSPKTARKLTEKLYQKPQELLGELASGRSYRSIAGTEPPVLLHELNPPNAYIPTSILHNPVLPSVHLPTVTPPTRPSWLPASGSNETVKIFDINRKN